MAVSGCRDDSEPAPSDDGAGSSEGGDEEGSTSDDGEASTGAADGSGSSGDPIDEGPWDTFEERPCPDDSFVTFENFGWPHMLTFCNGCHSSMLPADMRQGAPIEIN
ncbi:MAG: hypothetical protein AAF721_33390, partial [Myxococcota bacterium]